MPADTPLWKAHDVSQDLQDQLETLPRVDRAFVHVDHEVSHVPVSGRRRERGEEGSKKGYERKCGQTRASEHDTHTEREGEQNLDDPARLPSSLSQNRSIARFVDAVAWCERASELCLDWHPPSHTKRRGLPGLLGRAPDIPCRPYAAGPAGSGIRCASERYCMARYFPGHRSLSSIRSREAHETSQTRTNRFIGFEITCPSLGRPGSSPTDSILSPSLSLCRCLSRKSHRCTSSFRPSRPASFPSRDTMAGAKALGQRNTTSRMFGVFLMSEYCRSVWTALPPLLSVRFPRSPLCPRSLRRILKYSGSYGDLTEPCFRELAVNHARWSLVHHESRVASLHLPRPACALGHSMARPPCVCQPLAAGRGAVSTCEERLQGYRNANHCYHARRDCVNGVERGCWQSFRVCKVRESAPGGQDPQVPRNCMCWVIFCKGLVSEADAEAQWSTYKRERETRRRETD